MGLLRCVLRFHNCLSIFDVWVRCWSSRVGSLRENKWCTSAVRSIRLDQDDSLPIMPMINMFIPDISRKPILPLKNTWIHCCIPSTYNPVRKSRNPLRCACYCDNTKATIWGLPPVVHHGVRATCAGGSVPRWPNILKWFSWRNVHNHYIAGSNHKTKAARKLNAA